MAPSPTLHQALLGEAAFRQLLGAGGAPEVTARGSAQGYQIEAQFGDRHAVLVNAQGQVRRFASLSTIATLLRRMGCLRFGVDSTDYTPGRIRPAQPSRSEAMKAGRLPRQRKPPSEKKPPSHR